MDDLVATISEIATPLSSRMDASKERNWLAAAQRGEAWALEQFYEDYRHQIYTLCRRLVSRTEDAEDVVQSTFVRAFRALSGFRGDSSPKTWLYRIAVNECVTLLRRRRDTAELVEEEAGTADVVPTITSRMAVRSTLGRVRPDFRLILVLRYWEDLPYEEIAAILKISLPAVKMRLSRAKAEFRKYYGDDL